MFVQQPQQRTNTIIIFVGMEEEKGDIPMKTTVVSINLNPMENFSLSDLVEENGFREHDEAPLPTDKPDDLLDFKLEHPHHKILTHIYNFHMFNDQLKSLMALQMLTEAMEGNSALCEECKQPGIASLRCKCGGQFK